MKKALFPVIVLAVSTVCASLANAAPSPGPKRPGPSAVEAARLKKNPPPNYLSHYLPDDRYKIAGGVWKYVSTDLDTYYHIPSSPNMLRQPANRVIGFANARDAEEAGYVADPTDGTASKAAPTISIGGNGSYAPAELSYINGIKKILKSVVANGEAFYIKTGPILQVNRGQQSSGALLASVGPVAKDYLRGTRNALAQLNRLRPPSRWLRFHSLLRSSLTIDINVAVKVTNAFTTGDISQLEFVDRNVALSKATFQKALAEIPAAAR